MHVTLKNAEIAIVAAIEKAKALKTHMCIAVVDSGANLKAFHRMDDACMPVPLVPAQSSAK